MDIFEEMRFVAQVTADAERTLLCEPSRVEAVQAAVDELGLTATFTVQPSPVCPPGKILVLDPQAMEASWRQTVQQFGRGVRL